jgi:hypothetical protein
VVNLPSRKSSDVEAARSGQPTVNALRIDATSESLSSRR